MKMMVQITVPKPCSESWDAMKPASGGRHCAACAHTVIDFTGWEVQEIAAYLQQNESNRTCGRFRKEQLSQPFELRQFAPQVLQWRAGSGFQRMAAMIIIFFAVAVSSCAPDEKPTMHLSPVHLTDVSLLPIPPPASPMVVGFIPPVIKPDAPVPVVEAPSEYSTGIPVFASPPPIITDSVSVIDKDTTDLVVGQVIACDADTGAAMPAPPPQLPTKVFYPPPGQK